MPKVAKRKSSTGQLNYSKRFGKMIFFKATKLTHRKLPHKTLSHIYVERDRTRERDRARGRDRERGEERESERVKERTRVREKLEEASINDYYIDYYYITNGKVK